MVASIALTLIQGAAGITLTFDLSNRDLLLTVFFTTVGLSARVSMLRAGGITLIVLTLFAMTNLVLQNVVGGGLITVLGLPPAAGLLLGSAALSGGHGTVLAWAPLSRTASYSRQLQPSAPLLPPSASSPAEFWAAPWASV